jgi:uncharacterized protein (TIGR03067 family)
MARTARRFAVKQFHWPAAAAVLALFLGGGVGGADDKEDAAKKELKAMEGNWQVVREEQGGRPTPKPVIQNLRIVVEGNAMAWYIGNPKPPQTADFKVDPTNDPRTIDAEITKGSFIGKKMLGIYKLDGDTLEICWGEPGNEKRPTKFTTRPGVGAGNRYITYKRDKEK